MSQLAGLLFVLRERGVELVPDGPNLRYRAPTGALTPDLKGEILKHKPQLLAYLHGRPEGTDPSVPRPAPAYAFSWPDAVPALGTRHVGPFTPCHECAKGTWVIYGQTPLCLECVLSGRGGAPA